MNNEITIVGALVPFTFAGRDAEQLNELDEVLPEMLNQRMAFPEFDCLPGLQILGVLTYNLVQVDGRQHLKLEVLATRPASSDLMEADCDQEFEALLSDAGGIGPEGQMFSLGAASRIESN